MTPRQRDELQSIPIGHMLEVVQRLKDAGETRAADLLAQYEERLAIIAEGRDVQPEDISAAWESVLETRFPVPRSKQADD